jgi:hypothetical protein
MKSNCSNADGKRATLPSYSSAFIRVICGRSVMRLLLFSLFPIPQLPGILESRAVEILSGRDYLTI